MEYIGNAEVVQLMSRSGDVVESAPLHLASGRDNDVFLAEITPPTDVRIYKIFFHTLIYFVTLKG